jgi:hypothetical protein
MDLVTHHLITWITLLVGGGIGGLEAKWRFLTRATRFFLAMLDCQADRIRWEERDVIREREIKSLRIQVGVLQADVDRLVARSVASGVVSGVVIDPGPSETTIPGPKSATSDTK